MPRLKKQELEEELEKSGEVDQTPPTTTQGKCDWCNTPLHRSFAFCTDGCQQAYLDHH